MTVEKLIKELSKCDPKTLVVLSSDSEGNSYAPLSSLDTEKYKYKDGEIGLRELTKSAENAGYSEEDVMKSGQVCVVIWP